MNNRQVVLNLAKFSVKELLLNFKDGSFYFVPDVAEGYPNRDSSFRTEEDLWLESQVRPLLLLTPALLSADDLDFRETLRSTVSQVVKNVLSKLEVRQGQAQVEFAYLALCLETLFSKGVLVFSDGYTEAKYLRLLDAFAEEPVPDNNWLWFALYPALAAGRQERALELLEQIETHYRGDGWYADGTRFDYYSAWSYYWWPFFCFNFDLDARVAKHLNTIDERFLTFARNYSSFFDAKGRVPKWGRSSIYSHAVTAPFVAAAFRKRVEGYNTGSYNPASLVVRNLTHETSKLTYWNTAGRGCIPSMKGHKVDPYSCVASPMWAFKTYWCLILPKQSPFWNPPHQVYERTPYKNTLSFGLTVVNSGEEARIVFPQRVVFPDTCVPDLRYLSPRPSSEN